MQTRSQGSQNLIQLLDHIHHINQHTCQATPAPATPIPAQPVPETPAVMAEQVPQPRVIGAGDAPNTHSQRQGIVAPPVNNNNFKIKTGLISMIQNHKFYGFPMENPLAHLDQFDRLCELTKINGISEDSFKLRHDMIMESSKDLEYGEWIGHEDMDKHGAKDALEVPLGAKTRLKTKKFNHAIGGLLNYIRKHLDLLSKNREDIIQTSLVLINAQDDQQMGMCSICTLFPLSSVLSHWVFRRKV